MSEQKPKETHTHHHWHDLHLGLKCLFYAMLVLIVVANLIGSISLEIQKEENAYQQCVDACSEKHFMGTKTNVDDFTTACSVNEFDRTQCIKNCNNMYLVLNQIKR